MGVRPSIWTLFVTSFVISAACGARKVPGPTAVSALSASEPIPGPGEEENWESDDPSEEIDPKEHPGALPPPVERPPHPLEGVSDPEIEDMLLTDASQLGAASLGRTNSGALFGGIPMPESPMWNIVNSRETFGTHETIEYLSHSIARVNEMFPDTPAINIGDISTPKGGHFSPHVSHQSGRDVDLGFYYVDQSAWYAAADASNLDLARTWALIKVTITETDVEAIFIDRSLQAILRDYATELGEDEAWLDSVFGGPSSDLRPILLHEPGHHTHLHIRYYNPIAQETGRRIYKHLVAHNMIKPPTYYVRYKAKRGDSLIRIAKTQRSSVSALKKANGLKSNRIFAGRTYKIPRRGGVAEPAKLALPARRIPDGSAVAQRAQATGSSAGADSSFSTSAN